MNKEGTMPKRLAVLGAAIGVLALTISIISPASSDDRYERRTIRLVSKHADDAEFVTRVDVGKKGDSVGDYGIINDDPLFNRSLTKVVGTTTGHFFYLEVNEEGELVATEDDLTIELRNGTITVEGTDDFSQTVITYAVTGGTGAYKTAHGELEIDFTDPELAEWTFRLLL
jgi:allene oxide cyclase-like protein